MIKYNKKKENNVFKVNEYFEGNVKSLSFKEEECDASIGVMAKGDYEFGTSTKEIMTVISGELVIQLPGSDEWKKFGKSESFTVEANKKFKVKTEVESAYHCLYVNEHCGCCSCG
jgi:purine/pyrimidine-nucleoside phosphorylase